MIPMNQRKKRIPGAIYATSLPKEKIEEFKTEWEEYLNVPWDGETVIITGIVSPLPKTELLPHQLRNRELAQIHGISEADIFVDPKNGVELYRSKYGWVHDPKNRGVE